MSGSRGYTRVLYALLAVQSGLAQQPPQQQLAQAQHTEHLTTDDKPNVLLVLVDDQGHGDIALDDAASDFDTPALKGICAEGVKLANFYSGATCTPSRAMLMTGRYPLRYGFQDSVIHSTEPRGVPLTETFLPEKMKRMGYETIMIGKWHLGMHQDEYLPSSRGFDNFYGILTGGGSHTKHISVSQQVIARGESSKTTYTGANLWDNGAFSMDNQLPTHTTELYTKKALQVVQHLEQAGTTPWFMYLSFQAIHDPIEVGNEDFITGTKCNDIDEALSNRRIMCGMMAEVDDGILQIRGSLEHMKAWERTVFVYASDNGGLTSHGSSNAPFRGQKGTYWEGGVHVPAFVGGGYMTSALAAAGSAAFTLGDLAHMTDLHTTILSIAGYDLAREEKVAGIKLDGVDLWDSLVASNDKAANVREEVLINVNSALFANSAALRVGDYKLMINADPKESNIYMTVKAHLQTSAVELATPDLIKFASQQTDYLLDGSVYLFNVALNPSEIDLDEDECGDAVKETCRNLAGDPDFSDIQEGMMQRIDEFKIASEPSSFAWQDDGPLANPALFDNLWGPWRDTNGDPKAFFLGLSKVVTESSTDLMEGSSLRGMYEASSRTEIFTALSVGGALLALVATVAFRAGRRGQFPYQPVSEFQIA